MKVGRGEDVVVVTVVVDNTTGIVAGKLGGVETVALSL